MRTLLALSVLVSLWAGGAGCSTARDEAAPGRTTVDIARVSVDELDRMLANRECVAVDANGTATRQRMGVIPGAVLLGDDSIANLPPDRSRPLVFYCANEACRSSDEAAARAIAAGYTRVKVLPQGIAGWVKAGKQTASI